MRKISEKFMHDLLDANGVLHPFLERIQKDHTLMLAIRENYINIYYRGGNILKLKEDKKGFYQASFDGQYNKSGLSIPYSPSKIYIQNEASAWVESFSIRKNVMDVFFSKYGKAEREFQQLIARENNYSCISNASEYFISDIEIAEPRARFDLLSIRWLAGQRKNDSNCNVALMEMKYGEKALTGNAGLLKHLKDMEKLVSNQQSYLNLLETVTSQFTQLTELGLLKFKKAKSSTKFKLDAGTKPELIFILANHNPRSSKLKTVLESPEFDHHAQSDLFDLKFFVSSFAGYGLHSRCMLNLSEFRKLLQ